MARKLLGWFLGRSAGVGSARGGTSFGFGRVLTTQDDHLTGKSEGSQLGKSQHLNERRGQRPRLRKTVVFRVEGGARMRAVPRRLAERYAEDGRRSRSRAPRQEPESMNIGQATILSTRARG